MVDTPLSFQLNSRYPFPQRGFLKFVKRGSSFADGPIRRIDQWMEVLGTVLKPVWI